DVIVQLAKQTMGEDELCQSCQQAHEKHLTPAPRGWRPDRALEPFCFGDELSRHLIARRSRDGPTEPRVNASDQVDERCPERALLHSTFGDAVLNDTIQREQPRELVL